MVYWFSRLICLIILKIFCGLKATGLENIPKGGGFILAANHVSYLDPPAVGAACSRPLNFMARHDLFSVPVLSWLLPRIRTFPVKRGFADISALREAIRRVKNGGGLVIFPEGRRVAIGESAQAESGIGLLVKKLDVPVIPAYVKGTEVALPMGAKFLRTAHVSVHFGKEIAIERRLSRQDIADEILKSIKNLSC